MSAEQKRFPCSDQASTWLKCRECGVRLDFGDGQVPRPEWEGMGEQLVTCRDCEKAQAKRERRERTLADVALLLEALDAYTKPGHHARCSGPPGTCSCGFYDVMTHIRALKRSP